MLPKVVESLLSEYVPPTQCSEGKIVKNEVLYTNMQIHSHKFQVQPQNVYAYLYCSLIQNSHK